MEGAAVLTGIAAVFFQAHLDLVAGDHGRVNGVSLRDSDPEAEHGFVERQGRGKVLHREVHVVALVAKRFLKCCRHGYLEPAAMRRRQPSYLDTSQGNQTV